MAENGETFGLLDIHDHQQILQYEHEFFKAYASLVDNRLVRLIWDWDDQNQRLKAKVPYSSQIIYVWRDAAQHLLVAMAINADPVQFQGQAFGFGPTAAEFGGQRYCEIINVMSTEYLNAYAGLSYAAFIRNYGFNDLLERGYDIGYSTCTRRRLRPYQRMGAKLIQQTVIENEERFFLVWPFHEILRDKIPTS